MLRQDRHNAARRYGTSDRELETLLLRMRRLALHRGYLRTEVESALLRRLMPLRKPSGRPAVQLAALRQRVEDAGLDRTAIAYLNEALEAELEYARLKLT